MADSGCPAQVFESIAVREILNGTRITTNGANLITPNSNGDELVLNGSTNCGLSISSTSSSNIYFGDAEGASQAYIKYQHSGDYLFIGAGAENRVFLTPNGGFELPNATDTTPTLLGAPLTSGAIFISGGGLWYKGFSGTYTEVAVA